MLLHPAQVFIEQSKIMNIKYDSQLYACNNGHTFEGKEAKCVNAETVSEKTGSGFEWRSVIYTNRDGDMFRADVKLPAQFNLVACPACGVIQLGGFELAKKST